MAGNENTAEEFDPIDQADDQMYGDFNARDLRDLEAGRTDAQTVIDKEMTLDQKAFDIRRQIVQAGETLSDAEQKRFLDRLSKYTRSKNEKGLLKLGADLGQVVEQTQNLTRQYFSRLDQNKDLFGVDEKRGVNTLKEYKDDFKGQTLTGKKKYMNAVDREIESLRVLKDRVIQLVGNSPAVMDEFNTLRRSEKRDKFIPTLENNKKKFDDMKREMKDSGKFDAEEIKMWDARFQECHSLKDQENLLQQMEAGNKAENGGSVVQLKEEFDQFSYDRQQKHKGKFNSPKKKDKKEAIEEMREELRQEYKSRIENSKYFSPEEKNQALESIKRANFDIKLIEASLADFPQFEAKAKRLADVYEKLSPEGQKRYDFWNVSYTKKKTIVESIKKHNELMEKFSQKARQMVKDGLICAASVEGHGGKDGYIARFEKLSLQDKKKEMENSILDNPLRKQTLDSFNKLLPKIPEKRRRDLQGEFQQARLEERVKILLREQDALNEKAEKLPKMVEKIDQMVAKKLLAPKSGAEYKKWAQTLSGPDLTKYLEHSELDDPRRAKALELFQSQTPKIREQNADFYSLDLNGRLERLMKLCPADAKKLTEQAEAQDEAKEQVEDLEKGAKIQVLRKMADTFKSDGNEKAEIKIHEQILEIKPHDEISTARLRELEMKNNPFFQMLASEEDPQMVKEMEALQVVDLFEKMIHLSETAQNSTTFQGRADKFGNARMQALNTQMMAFSHGKKMIDEGSRKAVDIQTLEVDNIDNVKDPHLLDRYVQTFVAKEPRKEDMHMAKTMTARSKEGRELSSTELRTRKDKMLQDFTDRYTRKAGGKVIDIGNAVQRKRVEDAVKGSKRSRLNKRLSAAA